MTVKSQRIVRDLFGAIFDDPRLLPLPHQANVAALEQQHGPAGRARAVADYIAGMTDRYAIAEHRKLFNPTELT
jgi:dGTPase